MHYFYSKLNLLRNITPIAINLVVSLQISGKFMSDTVIYHNPRCSKSRATLNLLEEKGVKANVVKYLDTPPSKETLVLVLDKLGLQPRQLMRTHEAEYSENNLSDESLTNDELIAAMIKFPKIIERPIVISGGKVAIGRPPESVLDIL